MTNNRGVYVLFHGSLHTVGVVLSATNKRRRHHGVDGCRVAPSANDGNDLFFGLFTAEQWCIGWNALLWPSWSKDDEKWKSPLTWRVKKCLHWDFWQSCFTVVCCFSTSC